MITHCIYQAACPILPPVPYAVSAFGEQPVKLYPSAFPYSLFFQGDAGALPYCAKNSACVLGIPKQFCLLQCTGNFTTWLAAKKEPISPRPAAKGVLAKKVTKYRPDVSLCCYYSYLLLPLSIPINLSRKGLVKI